MAQGTPDAPAFQKEVTFTNYSHEQGKYYAAFRRNYVPSLYDNILKHHTATGGELGTLMDVGCGPGLAAYTLAPHFSQTIGLDPSAGMLSAAAEVDKDAATANHIRFVQSTAEELGSNLSPPIPDSSVDLITASNAAHWFNMVGFWPAVARVLKPGGTVAMWCSGQIRIHPSVPNAAAIQAVMDDEYGRELEPYEAPGSSIARDSYINLTLPWTLEEPLAQFPKSEFFRRDWQPGEPFFVGGEGVDPEKMEKMLGTGSSVTRWREANPEKAGTEQDILRTLRTKLEALLHEVGVEKGDELMQGHVPGALLMVKKRE